MHSSVCCYRDFLDVDMSRTKVIIGCLSPLLALEDPHLEKFITRLVSSLQWCALNGVPTCRSECAYYFSLSWLITWYGHVVKLQTDAHRLADVFLATHPLMPVYVAAAVSSHYSYRGTSNTLGSACMSLVKRLSSSRRYYYYTFSALKVSFVERVVLSWRVLYRS